MWTPGWREFLTRLVRSASASALRYREAEVESHRADHFDIPNVARALAGFGQTAAVGPSTGTSLSPEPILNM